MAITTDQTTTQTIAASDTLLIVRANVTANPSINVVAGIGGTEIVLESGTLLATGANAEGVAYRSDTELQLTADATITADGYGVSGYGAAALDLTNRGLIQGDIAGVFAEGFVHLSNYGDIFGPSAIRLAGAAGSLVENHGTLFGLGVGFSAIAVDFGAGNDRFDNSGMVFGGVAMGAGNDVLANNLAILGDVRLGAGNDRLDTSLGQVNGEVHGDAGNDTLIGSRFGEILNGDAGNDRLFGRVGDDVLQGGAGNDVLDGGAGADRFVGAGGHDLASYETATTGIFASLANPGANTGDAVGDTYGSIENLRGSRFADELVGNGFANVIAGGTGADIMRGRNGNDLYYANVTGDRAIEQAGEGRDAVRSTATYVLGANVEDLWLDGARDIKGSGNRLNNVLIGNAGDNRLNGAGGNDLIMGGHGKDRLIGGAGYDRFDFDGPADAGNGARRDVIADFGNGPDRIDLSTIDANSVAAGNQAFHFVAEPGAAFSGARGELRWYREDAAGKANDKTIVMADVNGDRIADFSLELTGLKTLHAFDFVL